MARVYLFIAALSGGLAVALGAFGAHALAASFSARQLDIWHTAVQYQFWHGLALGLTAILLRARPRSKTLRLSGALFTTGLLLFCGSLYVLVLSGIKAVGIITPVGGVAWLVAWASLAVAAWKEMPGFDNASSS